MHAAAVQPSTGLALRPVRSGRFRARWGHVTGTCRAGRRLMRLARTWRERASVVRFGWLQLLCRHGDARLRLRGVTYTLSPRSGEYYPLLELHAEGAYVRATGFAARPGWVVVDVGANVGAFSAWQARRGARVYACEPNPDCRRRFARTMAENGLGDRVTLVGCAVGASPGTARMRVAGGRTEMGRVELVDTRPAGEDVPVRSLDGIAADLGLERVDLLKIDTEGFEAEVLRGAAGTLAAVDRVVLEYHSDALLEEASRLLASHGLRTALVSPDRSAPGQGELYATRL